MFKPVLRLASLIGLAAIGACASNPSEPCPVSGVLGEAETKTIFAGSGRAPADIVQKITLSNARVSCNYRGKKSVVSSVSFDITVEAGATAAPGRVDVTYFVAVSRGGQAILARKAFTRRIHMGKNTREAVRERVGMVKIPFAEGTIGPSYEIIVGLVLTPEQLAYNRERRGQ